MLSRHAEDLFWIGRYMERAENTARLLDVTYHSALEAGSDRSADDVWGDLHEMLFLDADEIEGIGDGRNLIFDPELSFSIRSIVAAARENARGTRELLSAEVWEAVNMVHLELGQWAVDDVHGERPYLVLRRIKSRGQTFVGAVASTMARNDGYRFIVIGQMLERAATTARTLEVWNDRLRRSDTGTAHAEWVKLLRGVSAYEAYLRIHRAEIASGLVLEFLLQSDDAPRSVGFCLRAAEECLAAMATGDVGVGSRRAAGRLRADIDFSDPATMGTSDLSSYLEDVARGIFRLADEIEREFFRPGSAILHAYEAF